MFRHFISFLFFILVCKTGVSQQFNFEVPQTAEGGLVTFDDRLQHQPQHKPVISTPSFYKEKKIKKIMIYADDTLLMHLLELDTAAKFVRQAFFDGIYLKDSWSKGVNPHINTVSYFEKHRLIRTDTVIRTNFYYRSKDTLMSFAWEEERTYKAGSLLNQQNRYFNQNFLDSPIVAPKLSLTGNRTEKSATETKIYLTEKIPIDFDSLRLYLASRSLDVNYFQANKINGNILIDTLLLKKHAFYRIYNKSHQKKTFVAGEDFVEPEIYATDSNSSQGLQSGDTGKSSDYDFTTNENGLYNAWYHITQEPEKNKKAIAKYRAILKKEGRIFANDKDYPILMKTNKKLIYSVRYEYFE